MMKKGNTVVSHGQWSCTMQYNNSFVADSNNAIMNRLIGYQSAINKIKMEKIVVIGYTLENKSIKNKTWLI